MWPAAGWTRFWEFGLKPWDMAAGILLIGEAGGKCSDMRGAPVALRNPHLLADNGTIHQGMLGVFDDVFRGQYRYPIPVIKYGKWHQIPFSICSGFSGPCNTILRKSGLIRDGSHIVGRRVKMLQTSIRWPSLEVVPASGSNGNFAETVNAKQSAQYPKCLATPRHQCLAQCRA